MLSPLTIDQQVLAFHCLANPINFDRLFTGWWIASSWSTVHLSLQPLRD